MRARLLSVILVVALVAVPACASQPVGNPSSFPTSGHTLSVADHVLQRVGELQAAAIQANKDGGLSDHDAVLVVRFTVSTATVIKDIPDGWEPVVITSYKEIKRQLPASASATLAPLFIVIDALLGV